jgi:hypothetical protein
MQGKPMETATALQQAHVDCTMHDACLTTLRYCQTVVHVLMQRQDALQQLHVAAAGSVKHAECQLQHQAAAVGMVPAGVLLHSWGYMSRGGETPCTTATHPMNSTSTEKHMPSR